MPTVYSYSVNYVENAGTVQNWPKPKPLTFAQLQAKARYDLFERAYTAIVTAANPNSSPSLIRNHVRLNVENLKNTRFFNTSDKWIVETCKKLGIESSPEAIKEYLNEIKSPRLVRSF